ncbi:hypothetical protein PGN35_004965 [Nodosilinea sp. PGN35]|uniref:hypothetical protein n=1 Tax=Nodosilinea sp. PGN35 TaxID=3020489 RepID=UPI0023B2CDF9|nr:hypothetical protein [Nodosilinea sp. TSF1-S3]MDF0367588.1 hypothetical protein [Nodosilinea sp. TSF1-S3]
MLLSTFELLLKPITPTAGTISGSDRSILQGYFLNVANPNSTSLRLRLRFNAQTPGIDRTKLLVARDTLGTNEFATLTPGSTYDFRLNAGDTGLVILQPDIRTLNPANVADQIEVRGYVEIFAVSSFPFPGSARTFPLLVTPEHRGTFLPSPGTRGDFDQLIAALPTSSGSALLNVDTVLDPVFEGPFVPVPPFPQPLPIPGPIDPIGPVAGGINPGVVTQLENIQQVLNFMAQRLDDLSQPASASLPPAVANGAQRQPVS